MQECKLIRFFERFHSSSKPQPLYGHLELSYRCQLNCVHCYCAGVRDKAKELSTEEWMDIMDRLYESGCLFIIFTGGDPLIREDFLKLYLYAKKKGFLVSIFTSGQGFSKEVTECILRYPPYGVDITLNGITENTYEAISRRRGSFCKVMQTIKVLQKAKINLKIKTIYMTLNKEEAPRIETWIRDSFARPKGLERYFHGSFFITPRLNGNKKPCLYRLLPEQSLEVLKSLRDPQSGLSEESHGKRKSAIKNKNLLYRCNSWKNYFLINPSGKLRFCLYYDKFSIDLKKHAFQESFFKMTAKISQARFKTASECRRCQLRDACGNCPGRAFLETGNEESKVSYYCDFAKAAGHLI